jgi:hypothetical protein
MKRSKLKPKSTPKRVLRLPDLDHTKLSVLNTLGSPQSQRAYGIAIDDFIGWYCSEPRIAFNKTVVLRYRIQLEAKHLAPAHDQFATSRGPAARLRSGRCWIAQPGLGRGHSARQGREAFGRAAG